jgi:putative membrane protein
MERKSFREYFGVTLRGMAMGAADVVPGVSGGTIAFITGIYEELITSLSRINLVALKKLKSDGLTAAWSYVNGNFFVALFGGILLSVFSLAKLVTYLLDHHPILLWSFFFGLVLASTVLILRSMDRIGGREFFAFIVGTAIAAFISLASATASGDSLSYVFLSGAIAICAMILPGISGAFILVLLGSYQPVLLAVKSLDIKVIAVFMLGCVVGLLSFSKLLNYLFKHYKQLVLGLLSGFLMGSLVKIWPWKNNDLEQVLVEHSSGKLEYVQAHVWPQEYVDGEPLIFGAMACALGGLIVVFVVHRLGQKG